MSNNDAFPHSYDGLLQLIDRLRGPDGCPWDRDQTRRSLKHQFLEECYELVEAIEQNNSQKLIEELGDVLFHLAFQIHIGKELGEFSKKQVLQSLFEKLVRRHPHVFGDAKVTDARSVELNWEASKQQERTHYSSALDGLPRFMPSLAYARAMQERASRSGLNCRDDLKAIQQIADGIRDIETLQSTSDQETRLGDLLFSLVNAAGKMGLDIDSSLRKANTRFYRRFVAMEKLSLDKGIPFTNLPLDEREALWQEVKPLSE